MAYFTKMMKNQILEVIFDHAGLGAGDVKIDDNTDLYEVGMKSFASVQMMLALEDAFDIEFPDGMMKRNTFRSPAAIEKAVQFLMSSSEPWNTPSTTIGKANSPRA